MREDYKLTNKGRFPAMRRFALLLTITVIFPLLAIFLSTGVTAEDESHRRLCFDDFDGDGINDNAADEDGDGIPDNADPDFLPEDAEQSGLINFQASLKPAATDDALLTNYDKYGRREFCTRALSENRCGFTSDEGFGGSIGIGLGAAGGGGCAGGVCR